MGLNTGYLKAERTKESDENYTPFYTVDPIMKYIKEGTKVWLPFDCEWSAFYQSFSAQGGRYTVIRSDISEGLDFFTYEPPEYDCIVSNPPFTQKDAVIKRLYELGKPFAVLLPLNSLQGVECFEYFKKGVQILAFDKRIGFHNQKSMAEYKKGVSFSMVYFCRDILPRDLIIEELKEYKKPLINLAEAAGKYADQPTIKGAAESALEYGA